MAELVRKALAVRIPAETLARVEADEAAIRRRLTAALAGLQL
jgi:hypothetical protein